MEDGNFERRLPTAWPVLLGAIPNPLFWIPSSVERTDGSIKYNNLIELWGESNIII
jgi:hypothetical protein